MVRALWIALLTYVVAVAAALSIITLWESRYTYVVIETDIPAMIWRGCEVIEWEKPLYWRCPRFRLP